MAEYKKQAGALVTIAVVGVLILAGVSVYLFPSLSGSFGGPNTGSTSQNTLGLSTTMAYSATSTIPSPQTFTNKTVPPDPRLTVTPMNGLLGTSSNATLIAEDLASYFNELSITLVEHQSATCSASSTATIPGIPANQNCREIDYPYSTAIDFYKFNSSKGSTIYVDFFQGKFLELQYIVKNYTTLHDNSINYTNPSSSVASATLASLMANAYGIDLGKIALGNLYAGENSNRVSWYQTYHGLQVGNGGGIYIEYYPPTSKIIWLIVNMNVGWEIQPPWSFSDLGVFAAGIGGWNHIPSSITLNLSSSVALTYAKTYATNTLQMGLIGYSSVELTLESGHLYYAATVADQSNTYVLFVNPITGEVGYPSSS